MEKGKDIVARSRKKQKGNWGLLNLASSINYDRPGGVKQVGVKLFDNEVGLMECSRDEFC